MDKSHLGTIKKVDLRKAWNHEASDFTRWLSEDQNLTLLSEEIGVDIKLIQSEAPVGRYNVDILAQEESTGHKIVIENQLEPTNHDHLGKIITYASGLDAKMVVWIVQDVREEHRQAIDWLNEHTDEELSFFLIRVELWQIGDSPFAPKFDIVSKPNDWAKVVKQTVGTGEITETKTRQMEFWTQFKEYANSHGTNLRLGHTPRPQHWYNVSIGSRDAHISLNLNSFDEVIRTELYISASKDLYHYLESHKNEIVTEIGSKLEWMELPEKKASSIRMVTKGLIDNTDEWEKYFAWMKATAEKYYEVFPKWIKKFK